MMTTAPHNAPVPAPGCECAVCEWANRRIEREQRLDEDLAANYTRYLAGDLVSRADED